MQSVDDLRSQLKSLGYLSRGIERWFAHDPWSSRTFWQELFFVASKAAILIALFVALPMTAIASLRNRPLPIHETLLLLVLYLASAVVAIFALVVMTTLILKLRPSLGVDRPRALIAISLALSGVITGAVALWWIGFDSRPDGFEWVAGVALLFLLFAVATIVLSAALLSFAIHETGRIPAIHQRSRTMPISLAGALLLLLIFVPSYFITETSIAAPPSQVVVRPTPARVALIAVDGVNKELYFSRMKDLFPFTAQVPRMEGGSPPERWASVGTGTRVESHRVRSVEGIRLRREGRIIQSVSAFDFVLRNVASAVGLAIRDPLPPTERRRDYAWEILAERGINAASVNWWATEDIDSPTLLPISQERLFAEAEAGSPADLAVTIDQLATRKAVEIADVRAPRFVTVHLPALDIILNRLNLDDASRVATSLAALEGLTVHVADMRARGYQIVIVCLPGDGQSGDGVLAATVPLSLGQSTPADIAPSILALFGFPASNEMPGRILVPNASQQRIATYGGRERGDAPPTLDPEYYEKLRSLGYVK